MSGDYQDVLYGYDSPSYEGGDYRDDLFPSPDDFSRKLDEWGRQISEWWGSFTGGDGADGDGDGIPDSSDRYQGHDDNRVVPLADGNFYVHSGWEFDTGRPIWTLYVDNMYVDDFFIKNWETTNDTPTVGGEVGPYSGGFSYGANDGVTYHFEPVPW